MDQSLGLQLDQSAGIPIYKQLFDQIASRIRSGAFPHGFRLPPTRSLADEVGTHRNTVVRAYEDLEAAGFVTSTVGRGTFVASVAAKATALPKSPARSALPWSALLSRATASEAIIRFDRLARAVPTSGDLVNLTRMQPSADLLPDDLFRRCIDHVLRRLGAKALGYAPREGLPRLREAIAHDLQRLGVPAPVDQIVITTGSQQGLDLVARALLDPGDPFLVEASTYSGVLYLLSAAGARLTGVPADDDGPDLTALARLAAQSNQIKGFYLMPNCNNPTGRTITRERREALVAWSHTSGVPLIEDDYGADLSLDGRPPPPALRALDGDVIHVGTYSKKLIPALRVGYLIAPAALQQRLIGLKHTMDLGTSVLLQHALAEFLERGYLAAHLNKTLPAYRARRDALEEALTRHLPREVRWQRPERGVHLWLPLPAGIDPEQLFEEAQRRGVLVSPSTLYSVDTHQLSGVRLTYCAESPERLAEGARRFGQAYAAVAARRPGNSLESV